MQMLILSHVVVIEYWCIGKGMNVNPRVLNTDPVEHHFGNCRQMVGGSQAGLNVMGFDQGDTTSGLVRVRATIKMQTRYQQRRSRNQRSIKTGMLVKGQERNPKSSNISIMRYSYSLFISISVSIFIA